MNEEEENRLFDVSLILTFSAEDIDEAEEKVEQFFEDLYESGYQLNEVVTIEESVVLA